ncbi:OmpP1/FadL family transporter [Sphingomonas sp. M1-B02]|uniref:OmpP1/FadL family transporter n=1 Tax=Sphingomonas sp. M1-B02 TaxID=3114300 RepID=UPI00223F00BE|nr:outer membrane protein transport protein [Sphingomonas sp. S6-11]UZK64852.1 outer membrane protein transport protein [Sphingomonas sp. S6-11]
MLLKASLVAASALTSIFAFAGPANAQAFYLQEQSARGAGRAFSGEVADTGAPSLWWNPASIAGMTQAEAAIAAAAILPKGDVVNNATLIRRLGQAFAPVGGEQVSRNPINKGVLPSGAIAIPLNDRIAFGLALSSPYSFTTDYAEDSWARYSADRTKLLTIDIQPSVAVALTDWLRVGASLNVEYADASLSNALPNVLATLPDGRQELKGNGWDFGWSAGVQMHNDFMTVGIAYKSGIKHHLTGDLTVSGLVGPLAASNRSLSDVEATFSTPAQIIVGTRLRVAPKVTLNAQAVRFTWADFDAIRLGAPVNEALPQSYRNTLSVAGGIDYDASDRLTVRAGVQRGQTPTQNGLRDARVPDSNRWNYGVGGSYQLTPRIGVDLGANYVTFEDQTIDRPTAAYAGTAAQTAILSDGTLQNAHAIVLSLGARVGF